MDALIAYITEKYPPISTYTAKSLIDLLKHGRQTFTESEASELLEKKHIDFELLAQAGVCQRVGRIYWFTGNRSLLAELETIL